MSYQTVLVALDRDESVKRVISCALSLANGDNTKLFLIHVNQPVIVNTFLNGEMTFPIEIEQELLMASQAWITTIAEQYAIEKDNCFICEGDTKFEIIEKASNISADIIVVGSHQKHGLALLFSDTADAILHEIRCDLLAVHIE